MRCRACNSRVESEAETKCQDCLADAAVHDIAGLVALLKKSRDEWRSRALSAERLGNEQCDVIFELERKLRMKGAA